MHSHFSSGTLGKIHTFTLSPPGLFYGIKKFGIESEEDLYPYVTSIVPDLDIVPTADYQIGNVQNVPCTADVDSFVDYGKCHSAMRTLALLIDACPDYTHPGREWSFWSEKIKYSDTSLDGGSTYNTFDTGCNTLMVTGQISNEKKRCDYWNKEGVNTYNSFKRPKGWER